MVTARIVGKDGNGHERNLSAEESIAGVIALNPSRLNDVLEGLSFNGVRGIPSQVTQSLGERRIGDKNYELIEIKPKKPVQISVKYPVGSQRDWSRGAEWLPRHLLEIVEFISYGERFDIKYAMAQSLKLKDQSGSIKLSHLQSDKKGMHFKMEINGKDFGPFDEVSTLQLVRLE